MITVIVFGSAVVQSIDLKASRIGPDGQFPASVSLLLFLRKQRKIFSSFVRVRHNVTKLLRSCMQETELYVDKGVYVLRGFRGFKLFCGLHFGVLCWFCEEDCFV